MKHFYSTEYSFIPHSLRLDLPIVIYLDDFIYPRSPYLKLIEDYHLNNNISQQNTSKTILSHFIEIDKFINKNIILKKIYAVRGRITNTGNYKLKKESGEFLIKKEKLNEFLKYHKIEFDINSLQSSNEYILIDNLEKLNKFIFSDKKLIINIKGFINHLEIIKYNKEAGLFYYETVPEYLTHLYKNREVNYLMKVVEMNLNEIEEVINRRKFIDLN